MTVAAQHLRIRVRGVVQGVGFRPFIFGLARDLGLNGAVCNSGTGVQIEVEGDPAGVDRFVTALSASAPPLAVVESIDMCERPAAGYDDFRILGSDAAGIPTVVPGPDMATCRDCLRELRDPADRRHGYPFINCTNCGPRYTIIRAMPYDRCRTTMAAFDMCPDCAAEYGDPGNRRFHAEPTCCPLCGPAVRLTDAKGGVITGADPVGAAREALAAGRIAALKGLGGFHLACDAGNDEAVARLRQRKARDEKPFAVMVRDLEQAHRLAVLSAAEERLLSAPEAPIVLVAKRSRHDLSARVAPGCSTFGLMLPYTPLHHLLLASPSPPLVMTSGNMTDEPIAYDNAEALRRLGHIADVFLVHDREIRTRCDDSVCRVMAGRPRFLRRSRGYTPRAVRIPWSPGQMHAVLAVGSDLKNAICCTRAGDAFLSHHIGDLMNAAAYDAFLDAGRQLQALLNVTPEVVACDTHPAGLAAAWARGQPLPVVEVQHHHAHIASVLAEYEMREPVIGVCFDGLGWGPDGTVWGGEFLVCDLTRCERAGHLERVPQVGGDAAAKHPCRMAYSCLRQAFPDVDRDHLLRRLPAVTPAVADVLDRMRDRGVNSPLTSSAGRLFDAVSALLGICQDNTYEGQAPQALEGACAADEREGYEMRVDIDDEGTLVLSTSGLWRQIVRDIDAGIRVGVCARRFHNALADGILRVCCCLRERGGLETVACGGGVFANAVLLAGVQERLTAAGFRVLLNARVPAGDGGIALGQAAVARHRIASPQTDHSSGGCHVSGGSSASG